LLVPPHASRAPGDVAHADVTQVKRPPSAAVFTRPAWGNGANVHSYARSERAAARRTRGPAKVDDGEPTMDGFPEQ
jgi:hypothetical protein